LRHTELLRHDLGIRIVSEVVGLGPLERFLNNPEVSEVMVNGVDAIFIERAGQIERVDGCFADELSLRRVIERIFTPTGRRIDDACPMADARLPDGSRVNAVLAPPAVGSASLTIRRFVRAQLQSADIVRGNGASEAMLDYLSECVRSRRSIVVSGGTGSGKTTFLRYLASEIPTYERLITIEDAAELNLEHPNIVSLEVRSNNQEGIGGISIRDLVRNALRMRPDRILIGEVRGGEALDLLQAMNTGHEGSLTTLHANSPRDTLARLEVMAMMSGYDIPIAALREQIASAIDVIVQMSRDSNGRRFVSAIARVEGLDSGRIQLDPVFEWSKENGVFRAIGVLA
jgi:pilus assembly protein CpaF